MTEQIKTTEADKPAIEIKMADPAEAKKPAGKMISHPRDVATLVLTQINQVNAKKDELTIDDQGVERSDPAVGDLVWQANDGHRATRPPSQRFGRQDKPPRTRT